MVIKGLPGWQYVRIGIFNSLSLRSCHSRRVSSRDGKVSSVDAALGLGVVGVDGMGVFFLKDVMSRSLRMRRRFSV